MPIGPNALFGSAPRGAAPVPVPVPDADPAPAPQKKGFNLFDAIGKGFLEISKIHPQYQANQRKREAVSKALLNIDKNPTQAISDIAAVDADLGAQLYDKYVDNVRMGEATKELAAQRQQAFEDKVHKRAGMLVLAAKDAATYGPLRKRYYDYYQSKGVTPIMELPENYDEAVVEAVTRANVDPDEQMRLDTQKAYREMLLAQRDELARLAEEGRMRRNTDNIESRESVSAANRTSTATTADKNREAANERARLAREQRERLSSKRGKKIEFYRDKNGVRQRKK